MKCGILLLCIIGGLLLSSQPISSTPIEESDTESIDATTISGVIVDETTLSPVVTSSSTASSTVVITSATSDPEPIVVVTPPPTESAAPVPPAKIKSTNLQCTTARGKAGTCTTVSDCYTLVLPNELENANVPIRNRVLAEMLVEASGFCDGAVQARTDISPTVMDQVLRSQVLLCCPETPQVDPNSFILDEIDPTADVYDEMFRGKSCGHVNNEKVTVNATTTTTEAPSGNKTEEGKIVNGRRTRVGEYPYVVAMMNRNRQFCAGSLINQNTVLTAAHCVQHMTANDVKNLRLQIGDWDIYKTNDVKHEVRGVKAVKYHKGFSMKHLMHDIALLILDRPIAYTNTIQPVCLHTGTPTPNDGVNRADVVGWGSLSEGGPQPSDLRAVNVRVITPAECRKRYANTANKIGVAMICAGSDKGDDSCQGDSGGPLTMDNKSQAKQIGVVSWGIGCGRYPGVYTAVYQYLGWINTNMVKGIVY